MKSARVARMWHDTLSGHPVSLTGNPAKLPLTCTGTIRAGEGNRTLMTSLEGWGSTIELRPRRVKATYPVTTTTRV
jgi:hypothetical protein